MKLMASDIKFFLGRVEDLENIDFRIGQLVHDAIVAVDDFAELIAVVFRDLSSHPSLIRDPSDKRSEPICNGFGRLWVIEFDVVIDVGEVLSSLGGPNQSSS